MRGKGRKAALEHRVGVVVDEGVVLDVGVMLPVTDELRVAVAVAVMLDVPACRDAPLGVGELDHSDAMRRPRNVSAASATGSEISQLLFATLIPLVKDGLGTIWVTARKSIEVAGGGE